MSVDFSGTFWLTRAGRYANPLNTNAGLPLVYGDLTDGASGNWELPCIDTVNFVYAYAAHPVLSVANGNSINIYADDVLVDPANYTFNESNDYEGEGTIATIDFNSDQKNAVISVRGKGLDDGGTLVDNIVDILDDFLTVRNSFSSDDFEATAKAMTKAVFTTQAYKAAGVIGQDAKYWEILQRMMGSFLGSVFFDAEKKLVLNIDDGVVVGMPSAVIPKADTDLVSARQRLISLINRCPASYAYDYLKGEFRSHSNGATTENALSQDTYGVREPNVPYRFYWCRDLTNVEAIQTIITDKLGTPVWEIEVDDRSFMHFHVDTGDVVAMTFDELFDINESEHINQLFKILSVKPNFEKNRIRFRGIDTDTFLTVAYLADGTYLADSSIKAGGERDTTEY